MNEDFSIETAVERIIDSRTRDLFHEVQSSYTHANYRSAVVMLWSVAICDLLFKLTELRDLYAEPTAASILTDIDALRVTNPNSPEWELTLLDMVKKRTELLDAADYTNLTTLQKHRHLSAHPVLTSANMLYSPNRETTHAHMRNVLEGLLTKPAVMTKKIFDALVEDLETHRTILIDQATLTRYLEAKYFPHFAPATEDHVFRSLWAITFKTDLPRCDTNREINCRALEVLYLRRPETLRQLIQNNRDVFSNVKVSGGQLTTLLGFLSDHPELYLLLNDAVRALIEKYLEGHPEIYVTASFLSDSVEKHLQTVEDTILKEGEPLSNEQYGKVIEMATSISSARARKPAILIYAASIDFSSADARFSRFIRPIVRDLETQDFELLLSGIESNQQTYGRWRAERDHKLIKQSMDARNFEFDPLQYPHFSESIGLPRSAWEAPFDEDDE